MKLRNRISLVALILVTAALSCNLPVPAVNPDLPPNTSQPEEMPQEAPGSADYSKVRLELADLPEGFNAISESEMTLFGFDARSMLDALAAPLAKAEPQNLSAYTKFDGLNSTIVLSFIIQPLTPIERGAFDLLARNPERAIDLIANTVNDLNFTPQTEVETIGDAVVAAAFSHSNPSNPFNGTLLISRRNEVLQAVVVASLQNGTAAVTTVDVARIMDDKIRAAQE